MEEKLPPLEKNMMLLKLGYADYIVLPVTTATKILALLEEAYEYEDEYKKKPIVKPLAMKITTQIISGKDYKEARINYLLGVNSDD